MEYDKLKIKQTDFITKGIIGQGHFGEVSEQFIISFNYYNRYVLLKKNIQKKFLL